MIPMKTILRLSEEIRILLEKGKAVPDYHNLSAYAGPIDEAIDWYKKGDKSTIVALVTMRVMELQRADHLFTS